MAILYTPEAFKFMKRMEFKSILNRFDAVSISGAEGEEENIQKHFKVITNKKRRNRSLRLLQNPLLSVCS